MHGLILSELKKFVLSTTGPTGWTALLERAGLPGRVYLPRGVYADAEVAGIVRAAAAEGGLDEASVLEEFGRFLVPNLLAAYEAHVRPGWRTLDLLANAEETIHRVVRMRNPRADPPELSCEVLGADAVRIVYASPRRLCALARGIVRGIAEHYRERVEIAETGCMRAGAPACTLEVRKAA